MGYSSLSGALRKSGIRDFGGIVHQKRTEGYTIEIISYADENVASSADGFEAVTGQIYDVQRKAYHTHTGSRHIESDPQATIALFETKLLALMNTPLRKAQNVEQRVVELLLLPPKSSRFVEESELLAMLNAQFSEEAVRETLRTMIAMRQVARLRNGVYALTREFFDSQE